MVKDGEGFSLRFEAPRDARLEYKFVRDGEWVLDPKNPKKIDNTVGGENSVWEGPGYKLRTLEKAPRRPLRRSVVRVGDRDVVVFASKESNGHGVIVYGDGVNYEKHGKVQNVVQNLVEAGRIRPVVVVLVQPKDRMSEYGWGWKPHGEFLFHRVLPAVRKATGASAKAKDTFLGGSSLGGLVSLRLAEEFPNEVAGGVHSQSGAFQSIRAIETESAVSESSLRKLARTTRVWLCWGNYEQELTDSNRKAAATLKKMKRAFGSRTTNEGHTWTSWRNRMVDGLVYLLRD